MKSETIAAIATHPGNSGIGIIRVSGEDAVSIVDRLFVNKKYQPVLQNMKSHTIRYGFIIDENKSMIDEVMVSYMKAPNSFTTENTVEVNCHGGMLVMNQILELIIRNGARLAEPGEFTKRAFLNGRIDLSEAEAVMDVISSQNETALKNSLSQLRGSIFTKIKNLREAIIYETAFIESALDDPEHISLEGYPERLMQKVESLSKDINKLISTAENGRIIREGIKVVIVGKPNAGKSSLLNILSGQEKAIVTEIAGTTRDVIEENIKLDEINLHVIDTAGIRSTEDFIEKIGVEKSKEYAKDADLIIFVVDSSSPIDENDKQIIEMLKEKKYIVLFNKSDLKSEFSVEELTDTIKGIIGGDAVIIKTSTKENIGIEDFTAKIKEMFFHGEISNNDDLVITNMRHKEALLEASYSLNQVMNSLSAGLPEDFYSIDLMSAYKSLGKIIGEEIEDDLVNEIFSKFCMGK
ncbi:MAG: tRNA uridine-5-carboxymethylaminomethyl(34) synthesis GTPase MnmE [Lachnospiraceae bacterium]|nr:tRNA uridine-5-carboxymethylaminomethyl(34) synthesis GTPase MnmE [Lachnospiraceae bacterium]